MIPLPEIVCGIGIGAVGIGIILYFIYISYGERQS